MNIARLIASLPLGVLVAGVAAPLAAGGGVVYLLRREDKSSARRVRAKSPYTPPPETPERARVARAVTFKRMTWEGGFTYKHGGRYFGEAQWNVWMTTKPNGAAGIQYRKYGQTQHAKHLVSLPNARDANAWGRAMSLPPAGVGAIMEKFFAQRYIVSPAPQAKAGPFKCGNGTPGMNAAKNLACGRYRKQRANIRITVHKAAEPEWYVARWPWGSLAAAPSPEEAMAAAVAIVRRINDDGNLED